ncbi:hypothetical protein BST36_29110 [Mycolicibacterium moriokaense]|uniref:Uncharacterized protein n=1 Tax=Mycolicibacterium moriokaense TaxID=39691 RepID=A0AAD1M788_9MYCO|nr:hypothetical protein [Mycolicibacterium moriokaense]MCV7037114.1 hypothetical protein [Mycolicibacterium moriokaense]ORB13801.1 hypothetical protein BST36_29110 [Mycolicibacterium moriokaense]BBX02265.1 hypothetical protein MMOR_32010 [Mycolicibacterium moriokaense]
MTRRSADDQAAREARIAAIRACRRCDPCGWKLADDRTPIEPARRCDHGAPAKPPIPTRDVTEPIHQLEDGQ